MAWKFACWFILTTFRTDLIKVMVCWFIYFWCYFDLVKWVKFGVSRHFLENPLRKWPGILHAIVTWASSELSRLWSQFVDFYNFGTILTSWNGSNLGILAMRQGKFYFFKVREFEIMSGKFWKGANVREKSGNFMMGFWKVCHIIIFIHKTNLLSKCKLNFLTSWLIK